MTTMPQRPQLIIIPQQPPTIHVITPEDYKTCHKCNETLPKSEFSKHPSTKDKLDNRCKTCAELAKENATHENPRELDLDPPNLNNPDWQGGKYQGTIFKRTNEDVYTVRVDDKYQTFNPATYGSDAIAYAMARQWRKEMSDTLRLTKNRYKIIKVDNVATYVIVQLSHNYVALVGFNHLDFIREHTLCAGKSGNENGKYYCFYTNTDTTVDALHQYITNADMTDHISRYPLDNRDNNLRSATYSLNNKNRTCIHTTSHRLVDGRYEGTIIYRKTHKFEMVTITQICHSLESVTTWIKTKSHELDEDNLTEETLQRRAEYEHIMTQYAGNFKWSDEDRQENQRRDQILQAQLDQIIKENSYTTEKGNIYSKFLKVNPNYTGIQDLVKPGNKIEHIIDNGNEYKYCSKCDEWKLVGDFYRNKKNWDGLDRRCKPCKPSQK